MKNIYKKFKLFYSLIILLGCSITAHSTNIAAGNVSGNWTTSGSPYNIYGNITVANGTTLTIYPGVTVSFQGHYKLDVQGRLLANGTSSSKITFTAANTTTGWKGIRFYYTPTTNDTSRITYCKIQYGKATGTGSMEMYGGAIFFYNYSKVRIENCNITNNYATYYGGGICCYYYSSPKIHNNEISNNSTGYYGGGIYCYYFSSPEIIGNTIKNNSATYYGGGFDCYYYCSPDIIGNTISNNSANYYGGGMRIYYYCYPLLLKNKISNNTAGYYGGGIYCYYSSPSLINNLICNNNSNSTGGGLYLYGYSPYLLGNTIVNNHANSYAGGIYSYGSYPTIKNCIIWGNTGSSYSQIYPTSLTGVTYSDVQGGYNGTGNLNSNPVFTTPTTGSGTSYNGLTADWSLQSTSPCIDSGTNAALNDYPAWDLGGKIRVDGEIVDIGAYEYISSTIGCGTISTNTTWSNSVLIDCNVTITNGKTLTIEPGTRIKFLGPYTIDVSGRILAVGTIDSFINFYAYDTSVGWAGIRFNSTSTSNDSSKIEYCIIKHSKADYPLYFGGAIYTYQFSKVLIRSNIFTNNWAYYGGAIACQYSSPKIINNLIVNNTAAYYGGAIFIYQTSSAPIITNNTIVNNYSEYYCGGIHRYSTSYPIIRNNIIWGNDGDNTTGVLDNLYPSGMSNVTYNDIGGGTYTGTGNISSNPLFKYAPSNIGHMFYGLLGDWALKETSPCIDVGTTSVTGLELPPVGLKNKVRVFNSRVDMGAYEDKSTLTVCGTITSNTVWDANNIVVTCDVTVNNGVTLTINPGTKVKFNGQYRLNVYGTLIAEGTSYDMIKFFAITPSTGWKGIYIKSYYYYNNDSTKISYCDITDVKKYFSSSIMEGGAITLYSQTHKVKISNCNIHDNILTYYSTYWYYAKGAGIYCYYSLPIIENNIIKNNQGGGYGGGIYLTSCYPPTNSGWEPIRIRNNVISNNSARYGGGMYVNYCEANITNNLISNNSSTYGGGGIYISGAYVSDFVSNCITNNTCTNYGGGFYICCDTRPNLTNNTISNNRAYRGGGIYCTSNADPTIKNTILYGDSATASSNNGNEIYLSDISSDPKIYYSNIEGGTAGFAGTGSGSNYANVYQNNIDADPLFTSPSAGAGTGYNGLSAEWSLQVGSPCINLGTPDVIGLNTPTLDLVGNDRVFNGRIDMGAYESQDPITAVCNITSNTVWDADTIRVNCNITISNGQTLTIMPGTFVKFTGHYKIDVKGRLLALGTADEMVTFSINDTNHFAYMDTAVGGWNRIQFNSTSNSNDSSKFIYCNFSYGKAYNSNSYSERYGGAMYIYNYSKILITNCNFMNNRAYFYGGALFLESANPVISNSIFSNNSAVGYTYSRAGAIYMDDCVSALTNLTICHNESEYMGGGIYIYGGSSPVFKNVILYGNTTNYIYTYGSQGYIGTGCTPDFYNCDVQGGQSYQSLYGYYNINTYVNCINSNPLFTSPASGSGALYSGITADWSLKTTSPCINAGISVSGLYSKDFAGNNRQVGPIDIGAYEIQISRSFITLHPSNQVNCEGSAATFSVSSSVSVSYQWQKDSVNINGATSATLTLNNVLLSDTGSYLCILSNLHGSIYSDPATLTVHTSPVINTHPGAITRCLGDSGSFTITASGTPPISYQWYNTNGAVSGGTNSTFNINSVTANDASTYYCIATNNCGFATSNGALLTPNYVPTVTSITPNTTVCAGDGASYTTSATGTTPISYQWYKNSSSIQGATAVSYQISSVVTGDAGNYYCKATNVCGADNTNTAVLSVNTAPSIVSQTSNKTLCTGSSKTLSITAAGTAPITYQWYKNSVTITGATNNTYTLNNITTNDAATYYCIATNTCGSDQSDNIVITVNVPPEITAQTTNSSRCAGQSMTFSVTATGTPTLTYQWYYGATAISAATTNAHNINSVSTSDAGNYYCIVTNSCGNVQSTNISLTVNQAPNITYQTPSTNVCEGQGMIFSVSASGTAPISYQWYYNSNTISSATSNTYTINSVSTSNSGTYYCIATNTCGNDQSTSTILTVKTSPAFTAQTSSSTRCSGQGMTFSVTASGSTPITYQWYNNSGSINGATNSSYNINSVDTSHAGNYYCVATNSCGTVQSYNILLTVNVAPSITYQTSNTTLCAGQSMTFNVAATGTFPITYQWYKNSNSITGAANNTYTLNSIGTSDAGTYYCIATNSCGTDQSNNVTFSVNVPPTLTAQSSNATKCVGQSMPFSVTASGTPTITYQWYGPNGTISGATNNTYNISSVIVGDAGNYYCIASNSCGNAQSNIKILTVNTSPSIISQSANTTKCKDESMTFTVTATGTSPITYQWYNSSGAISGATSDIYVRGSIQTADAGNYYCIATNSCGTDQSNNITLTVKVSPSITAQSTGTGKCVGQSMTFSLTATGTTPLTYQWYNNNGVISNATNNSYTINSVSASSSGNYYCIVTNSCGKAQSSNIPLTVNRLPSITSQSDSSTLCSGQSTVLNVTATGTSPITYQWYFSSVPITGAENNFYMVNSIATANGGNYYCEATNLCGSSQSYNINLVVNDPISIIFQSGDSSRCVGESMTFSVDATGTAPISYQWYYGTIAIPGAINNTYMVDSVISFSGGSYYCKVTNNCGTIASTNKNLTIHSNPVITLGADTTFCKGGSITLTVGSGYFCEWNTGSTNPQLSVTETGDYHVTVEDIHGCSGHSDTVHIEVLKPFANEEICVVTIDPPTGKNLIAWERTGGQGTIGYNVYKESTIGGVYTLIGTQPIDSVSVWVDVNSNPRKKSNRYRITALDSCGNESEPSPVHRSLLLLASKGTSGENNLSWNDYEGFSFGSYIIYRGTTATNIQPIDTIENTSSAYIDVSPPSGLVFYQVSALKLDTCYPTKVRGVTSTGPYSQSLSNLRDYSNSPGNYLSIDPLYIELPKNAGSSDTINIFTNAQYWSASTTDEWLQLTPNVTEGTLIVTALTENIISEARKGSITISGDAVSDQIVTVEQTGIWPTAISDQDYRGSLKIYPNPFNHSTLIILPEYENHINRLEIYDISGKLARSIENINGNKYELFKDKLAEGIYFIRVIADQIYIDKVIVK